MLLNIVYYYEDNISEYVWVECGVSSENTIISPR